MQDLLAQVQPDDVNAATAGNDVIAEVPVVDAMVGEWVKDRRGAMDVVKLAKFISTIGVDHQEIIA